MARVHKSFRLDEDLSTRLTEWATDQGITVTQALEHFIRSGLGEEEGTSGPEETYKAREEAWAEQRTILGNNIADLRGTVSTLTAQLTEKDEQIRRLQESLEHSQVLQAANMAPSLPEVRSGGIWSWITRRLGR